MLFPDITLPAKCSASSEEFLKITEGSDAGWPYYYYDQFRERNARPDMAEMVKRRKGRTCFAVMDSPAIGLQ